jgi:hypothetical protein
MTRGLQPFWSMNMGIEHTPRNNPPNPSPEEVKLGYERRDANIRALLQFGFWMAVVIAATMVSMDFTLKYFSREMPLGAGPVPFATERQLPPSPRLQVYPHVELKDYCAEQQEQVTTYGWVDQRVGVVHIPIDRAMDALLARGLPSRPAGEVPTGAAAPAISTPMVSGEEDVEGQCGYVTEKPPNLGSSAPKEEPKD